MIPSSEQSLSEKTLTDQENIDTGLKESPRSSPSLRHGKDETQTKNRGATQPLSAKDNARILKKIDRHLMPVMFVIYFLQLMDKQTLAFSSVFGISRDTGLKGDSYSLLGSIVYIAQLMVQPFAAYFLVKLRLSLYIPVIVTCWGAALVGMAGARNFTGLLTARFFLGAFEASIQPAFILIGQTWYRRQEQGLRLAIWYSNNGWVNIFGSLLMFGLGHIQSKVLHSYQIMFIVLGLITLLVGLSSFFIFPDNLTKCKFLTPEEKAMAIERIRANQQGMPTKEFKCRQVLETFLDLKGWCWMALMFTASLPSGGINTFVPLILRGFGFNDYDVMLLLIPYGVIQVTTLFSCFWAAQRFRVKSITVMIGLMFGITSSAILLTTGRSEEDKSILLVAFYMLGGYIAVNPTIISWQSSNVAGHTKRTATTAVMTLGSISGNIVGPLLFQPADKPYYRRGITAILSCFGACFVLVIFTAVYLRYLNQWNVKRRINAGKRADVVDYSMMSAEQAERKRCRSGLETTNMGDITWGSRALEDITDLQNDEFIYIY